MRLHPVGGQRAQPGTHCLGLLGLSRERADFGGRAIEDRDCVPSFITDAVNVCELRAEQTVRLFADLV